VNIFFLLLSGLLVYVGFFRKTGGHGHHHHEMASKGQVLEKVLTVLAIASYGWLLGGLALKFLG
jgi:hypothetical protein